MEDKCRHALFSNISVLFILVNSITDDTYMYFLESSWDVTVGILIMIKLVNIPAHSYW
jgi:hypothetical protein